MINACIIGYGAIGPVHAKAILDIENVNLYGVCDIIKERADAVAEKHNAKAFYDFDDCLKDENIDYIHICTPHYLHFEMITKALDAGKRVVVEKPMVMKKEQFDILFEKYDVTKVFPIIQNRTNTCVMKLKEMIEENDYGPVKGVKGVVTWCRDEKYYNSAAWRGTKEYEGGGVLINQAIHTLDLLTYFAGATESVIASMKNHSLKGVIEVEDTVEAYIKYKSGATGVFYATNAYKTHSPILFEVNFEKNNFAYFNGSLFLNGELICSDSKEYSGKSYWGNGHTKTLGDLYSGNKILTLHDVKDTMYTMFAIYESADKDTEIFV